MKITVHERKSEDFNYGRVSTPVAQAYKVLDNQYCDERTGKITGPAFDAIMVMAENDRPIYDYARSKRVKSHSVAWMALLKDIAYTLQWHDDTPHANSLTSEQLKNWFRLKGQDYKEELAPLVKLVDEWRADMFKDESKQDEATKYSEDVVQDIMFAVIDDLKRQWKGLPVDCNDVIDTLEDLKSVFFDKLDWDGQRKEFSVDVPVNSQGDTDHDNRYDKCMAVADGVVSVLGLYDTWAPRIAACLYNSDDIQDRLVSESKQAESIVTDLTKAIQDNKPKVLFSDDATSYFDDYEDMLDEFEGAYQTIVHVSGKDEVNEMMFLYVPEENIIVIGDFDVDRANADRAKELMEKFVSGELEKKPGNTDVEGLDYVAIVDGNNYTSTLFVEGE